MSSVGRSLLDHAYTGLAERSGDLLDVEADPAAFARRGGTADVWTDLGDWLGLAARLGAERVLFVRGEPVIVFKDMSSSPTPAEIGALYRRTWCMSEPRCLFVATPGELQVYLLDRPPVAGSPPVEPWRMLRNADEVLALTRDIEDRGLDLFGPANQADAAAPARADQRLVDDLRHVRSQLQETGLTLPQAHALIGQSILIRYLEDRGVLKRAYFDRVADGNPAWVRVLEDEDAQPVFGPSRRDRSYDRVLQNPDFTLALFTRLAKDFNGDLFALGDARAERFGEAPLALLRSFLLGEAQTGQPPLFFWAYDFEVVPLSLISSIYEQFYHDARKAVGRKPDPDEERAGEDTDAEAETPDAIEGSDERQGTTVDAKAEASSGAGTHYTPASLVHDVLRRTLTPERLALRPRVLDLACGSGIFLVEAFRRIVRFEAHDAKRKLHPTELRALLRDRIVGVEINAEAARVAAFSLYLALLDQQEPPEILAGPPLPHLIHNGARDEDHYGAILPTDAFLITATERAALAERVASKKRYKGQADDLKALARNDVLDLKTNGFDVVVGNPPWEEAAKDGAQGRTWVRAFRLPVGEWSYSQLFMLRALALLKPGGVAGLLVNARVLWNQRATSQEFRRHFLKRATVQQVVNMTHVRRVFFAEAVAPFAFIEFLNTPPRPESRLVLWNARRTAAVGRQRSMALVPLDRRVLDQADVADTDHLWKTYWWGSHRDAALVGRLRIERTLEDVIKGVEPVPAYGWQSGRKPASAAVSSMRQLRSGPLEPFGPLLPSWFAPPPERTGRDPDPRIYDGRRLVVTRGVKSGFGPYARLEHAKFSFRHAVYCVPLPNLSDTEAKLVLGVMWSMLGRYRQFMTSGAWAGWFDQVTKEDVLSTPVRLAPSWGMSEQKHAEAAERIVAAVDRLRDVDDAQGALAAKMLATLDDAVFDLFEFSGPERDLVRDFWAEGFDLLQNGPRSRALKAPALPQAAQGTAADVAGDHAQGDLRRYLAAFLETWNPQLPRETEFAWQVARSPGRASLAVAFVPVRRGADLPPTAESEWATLAERCAAMLGRPVSPAFSVDWEVRGVSRAGFVFVKANTRRPWTASAAREDAEAAFLRLASEPATQV